MGTAFQTAAGVATPSALAAVAVVAVLYGLARYWRHRERQLLAMPEADRAASIEDWLRRLGYDLHKLTKNQKVDLAIRVMDRRQLQFYFAGSALLVLIIFLACSGLVGYLIGPLSAGKSNAETNNVALVFGLIARGSVFLFGVGMMAVGVLSEQRSDDPLWSRVSKLAFRAVLVTVGTVAVLFTVIRPFEFRSKDTVLVLGPPEIEREIVATRAELKEMEREEEATRANMQQIEREQETARNVVIRVNADARVVESARLESIKIAVLCDIAFRSGSLGLAVVHLADHQLRALNARRRTLEVQLRSLDQDLSVSEQRQSELSEIQRGLDAHLLILEQNLVVSKRHYGAR